MIRRGRRQGQLFPGARKQHPIPAGAANQLRKIPNHFIDDGCSNSPDSWFGFDFSWACRIHDWRFCTRAQPDGEMTDERREAADLHLRQDIRASLPWRWRWIRWIYYRAVRRFGEKAFDSCPAQFAAGVSRTQARAAVCRHGMTWPPPPPRSEATSVA